MWAQAELRKVLKAIGATVIPSELPVATASRVFSDEGRIEDRTIAAALAAIVGELVAEISAQAAKRSSQRSCRKRILNREQGAEAGEWHFGIVANPSHTWRESDSEVKGRVTRLGWRAVA